MHDRRQMPRINDYAAAFGLTLVSFTAWGPNVFGSQAYMMACAGLAALSFLTRDKILTAFGCYCAAWFVFIQVAETTGWMPIDSMIQAIDVLMLIMAGYAIYIVIKFGSASRTFWMNTICIVAVILSAIGVLQYYFKGMVCATLGNSNFLGSFLAISIICFFRSKWWMLLPLILFALYATRCATAMVALIIGLGYLVWGLRGVALAAIPGVVYVKIFKGLGSLIIRAEYWLDSFIKLSNHWHTLLFGTGPSILWKTDNMLHSEPAYMLWNFGFVGLFLAGAYIVKTFMAIDKPIDHYLLAIAVVIIVNSLANNVMHITSTAYLTVVIFALNDREAVAWRL